MTASDSLGDRMKGYERAFQQELPRRLPLVIRLDGVAFHTFCRGMTRPVDQLLIDRMSDAAIACCARIAGAKVAYVQSDEISILVNNYARLTTEPWLGNRVQKIASVAASIPSSSLSRAYGKEVLFDARAWILPEAEVNNYFLWRQRDAERNSVSSWTQAHYSPRECHGKVTSERIEMLKKVAVDWNALPTDQRRGRCILRDTYAVEDGQRSRWIVDKEIPSFAVDHSYIERHLATDSRVEGSDVS